VHFDTLIKNGLLVDGTRLPRRRADVGISGGRVVRIGQLDGATADRVLDATGLVVAPGFIDLHTHYDAQVFWDPYCSISSWHGITSAVIGNCGFGFAPVRPDERETAMRSMTRVEAIPYASMEAGMPWTWVTFPEFLDALQATPKGINILPYVPVGPLLVWVLGYEDAKAGRLPTDAEHAEMARLLHEAMDAGASGWSAQRLLPSGGAAVQRDWDGTPMVTDVMHDETCYVLADVLRERGEGFIQLTMVSGDAKRDAACYEELAIRSGRPVLYNVVIAHDDKPNIHRGALKWLKSCRERGIPVYGQGLTTDAGYTFTFEEWNLFDDVEAWAEATTGTLDEKLEKLSDPRRREELRRNRPRTTTGPIEGITVLGPRTPETKPFENLTIGEVAEQLGKDPIDALIDIAVADDLATLFFANPPNVSLVHLKEIVDDPYVVLGVSDGGAHTKFLTAGRYPTESIIKMVRENDMLSLEDIHWRLSALPAAVAGFADRGVIREGAPADIVVYDFENLEVLPSEIAYDLPGGEWRRVQRAKGYHYLLVNGEIVVQDDQETGVYGGALLRRRDAVNPDQVALAGV
jgi:N-acyl-D-amino-acid deacylase